MNADLNSVKTALFTGRQAAGRNYHHGALRQALIAAAEALIEEKGLEGFSLRETARRAGVSPSAPAHHFGDARGLLTAIATQGFEALAAALEAADSGGSRADRIRAQGVAYVGFALAHRAHFDLMWRKALLDSDNADYAAAGRRAFLVLDQRARGAEAGGGEKSGSAAAPSIACWALVHGFARLAIDGAFGTGAGAADRAAETLLPAILTHLRV
jgi:AcrR family transcriptional regulator